MGLLLCISEVQVKSLAEKKLGLFERVRIGFVPAEPDRKIPFGHVRLRVSLSALKYLFELRVIGTEVLQL